MCFKFLEMHISRKGLKMFEHFWKNKFLTQREMMPLLFVVLSVVLVETETPLIYYLVNISHLCIPEKKYLIRGNVRSDKCHSANCATGKCPFREVSLRGTVLWGTIRWGNVFGEMSIGEKSVGEISIGELP